MSLVRIFFPIILILIKNLDEYEDCDSDSEPEARAGVGSGIVAGGVHWGICILSGEPIAWLMRFRDGLDGGDRGAIDIV